MYGVALIIFLILSWIRYLLSRRKSHTIPKKPLLIFDMNNVLVARAFAPKLEEEFPGWNRSLNGAKKSVSPLLNRVRPNPCFARI